MGLSNGTLIGISTQGKNLTGSSEAIRVEMRKASTIGARDDRHCGDPGQSSWRLGKHLGGYPRILLDLGKMTNRN
jgi:hypothetical protein